MFEQDYYDEIDFPVVMEIQKSISRYNRQDLIDGLLVVAVCASIYQIVGNVSLFANEDSTAGIALGHSSSICLVLLIFLGMIAGYIYVVYNVKIWQFEEMLKLLLHGEGFDYDELDGSDNSLLCNDDNNHLRWKDEINHLKQFDGWMNRLGGDGAATDIFRDSGIDNQHSTDPQDTDRPFLVSTDASGNLLYDKLSDLSEHDSNDSLNSLVSENGADGDGSTARLGRRLDEIEQEMISDSLEAFHESLKEAFDVVSSKTRS